MDNGVWLSWKQSYNSFHLINVSGHHGPYPTKRLARTVRHGRRRPRNRDARLPGATPGRHALRDLPRRALDECRAGLFGVRRRRLHRARAEWPHGGHRAGRRLFERDAGRPGQKLPGQAAQGPHADPGHDRGPGQAFPGKAVDRLPAVLPRLHRARPAAGRHRRRPHHRRIEQTQAGARDPRGAAHHRAHRRLRQGHALPGRHAEPAARSERHDRQRRGDGHQTLGRPGHLGAAARFLAIPAARDRHRRQRQDPAGAGRIQRRHRRWPASAVCLLQPAAGRPHRTAGAGRRAGRDLPHAVGRLAARAGHHARLRGGGCVGKDRSIDGRRHLARDLAVRRRHRRRGPGFFSGVARHRAAHAERGRPRDLDGRPGPEPVRPRDGAAAGLGDAAFACQLPQPAPDRRHAHVHRRIAPAGGGGQPVQGRRHRRADLSRRRRRSDAGADAARRDVVPGGRLRAPGHRDLRVSRPRKVGDSAARSPERRALAALVHGGV